MAVLPTPKIHTGPHMYDPSIISQGRPHPEIWTGPKREVSAAEKTQVAGNHYKKYLHIQPWHIIDAYKMGFYDGNALKYLLRYKDKNGIEDLKKAKHYLEKLIENIERESVTVGDNPDGRV